MNEGISNPKEEQEREDDERAAEYFKMHPELVITPEGLREAGPEIAELEKLIGLFKQNHSLEELNAIVEISSDLYLKFRYINDMSPESVEKTVAHYGTEFEKGLYRSKIAGIRTITLPENEERKFNAREAARKDIAPIKDRLNILEKETNISKEKHKELKIKSRELVWAIGYLKNGKIFHD